MDYGDGRRVQLQEDPSTRLRTLSWFVEGLDVGVWNRHELTLTADETHPIIEMWKMALQNQGNRSQSDRFDGERFYRQRAVRSDAAEGVAPPRQSPVIVLK